MINDKGKNCAECKKNKQSKTQAHYKISQKNMLDNYMPGQRVQIDFAVKGSQNYLSIKEAMRCMREWAALYGMPFTIKADSGPSFRIRKRVRGVRGEDNPLFRAKDWLNAQ